MGSDIVETQSECTMNSNVTICRRTVSNPDFIPTVEENNESSICGSTRTSPSSTSSCVSPDNGCVKSCSSISDISSPDISPLVAHYHKYSTNDLGLYVSIAQGGLQRIRREAQLAKISLRDIVEMFGSSITNMAYINDAEIYLKKSPHINCFNGNGKPRISLNDYLWRIVRALNAHSDPCLFASDGMELSAMTDNQTDEANNNNCTNISEGENSAMGRGLRCLLLAFVYIDRACTRNPHTFGVTSSSVHRILLTAIYVATKFTDDMLPRAHWTFSKLGGVTCRELKELEGKFCQMVDFRFYVTEAEFQALCMEQLRCAVRSMRYTKEAKKG